MSLNLTDPDLYELDVRPSESMPSWLVVSISRANEGGTGIFLDPERVRELRDYLTQWLEQE